MTDTANSRKRAGPPLRIALALGLGGLGGGLFAWLGLPLPWMLGPVILNLLAALARAPIGSPARARPVVSIVIGVMLGSSFSPETVSQAAGWLVSLSLLALYLALTALVAIPYYRRVGGFDTVTAYFAGMPGGLTEMTFVGRDMGGDDRVIVLAHASRVVVVVILIALWARLSPGFDAVARQGAAVYWRDVPLAELAILTAGGVAGLFLGRALRLPAAQLLGPMIVSAALHLAGIVTMPPPREAVVVAQLVLGTIVGCRFVGTPPALIGRSILLALGATAMMLSLTALFAVALHALTGARTIQTLLAYSPGGLAEMSLVAIAMDADVAFVAVHHLARLSLILLVAPPLFRLLRGRGGG